MMGRRFDLAKTTAAYTGQARLTADWLEGQDLSARSSLPAWTKAELVDHVCRSGRQLVGLSGGSTREEPLSISDYVTGYAAAAEEIAVRSQGSPVGDLRAVADEIETGLSGQKDHPIPGPRGPIRFSDFVATRVLEVVAHTLDLSREAPLQREALATVTRLLVDVFADRHPGRAVELRVPPFAAVQVLEGTVHRRGTPPAVVEMDPVTWIQLATGRQRWVDATIVASGERSDLSALLPVLR